MRAEGKKSESENENVRREKSERNQTNYICPLYTGATYFNTSNVTGDFNPSNITGMLVGNTRDLALSVRVVDDDIDEDDELFAVLLEVVDAVNPHRVNLTERNISVLRIADDDGECDYVCASFC